MPALLRGDPRVIMPEGKQPGWTHNDQGMDGGKFGRVDHVDVVNDEKVFLYDKCVVHEGGHVITVTCGKDTAGEWVIGLVKEARDTAAPTDGETSLAFWGPPRGYRKESETPVEAAKREAGEEAGATVIKNAFELGEAIVNETIVNSWSPFVALEVDIFRLAALSPDHGEKIYKAQFFTPSQIEAMIVAGTHDGASTPSMVLMSMLMLYRLCVLPKLSTN